MPKKAIFLQPGFPLCLPMTAVSFRTQLNSYFHFIFTIVHTKQTVGALSNREKNA
jgi:hypothetical protein